MSNNVVKPSFNPKFTEVFPKMNNKNLEPLAPNTSNANIINIINPTVSMKH